MTMTDRLRAIILWNMLVVCMILHFNYHVSGVFYGIDVVRPDADGTFPPTLIVIRALFQLLPLLYAAALLLWDGVLVARVNAVLSGLYLLANAGHLAGEFARPPVDPSQVALLSVTLLLSIALLMVSVRWVRRPQAPLQA